MRDRSLPSPYRFLRTGPVSSLPPDPECSFIGSPSSASGSPGPFSTSLRHLRLATADALSVHEPSHRLSCSRRLILAESPMIYPRRDAFLKIKHSVAKEDTPSMCVYAYTSWFFSQAPIWMAERVKAPLGSCPRGCSGARGRGRRSGLSA